MSINSGFYSGLKPNLLNDNVLDPLDKLLNNNQPVPPTTGEHLFKMYDNYIKPNLFAIFVFIVVGIFLFIKYAIKKFNEKEIKENDNIPNKKQLKKNNKTNKTNDDIDDLTTDEEEDNIEDESEYKETDNFEDLNEEYHRMLKENIGLMSEPMIKDLHKRKMDRFSMDELTRIMVEGCPDDE